GKSEGGFTLLYYTRAHEGMGMMGLMGMRGLMGGVMGMGLRDGNRGAGTFTGWEKHVYKGGERGLHGGGKEGKRERRKEKKSLTCW
ncbi:MAG: hypothetical protein IJA00_09705, partial [Bacteroidaceae bacterium]|nr:hypothetical protein [Bacteroidaceae bacterium]